MESTNGYSSPKTSSYSSFSSPKSSSYESSKVSAPLVETARNLSSFSESYNSTRESSNNSRINIVTEPSSKNSLNNFRDLLTNYLELEEQIEMAQTTLEQLNEEKRVLEEQIANDPRFETFSEMFDSIKGTRK